MLLVPGYTHLDFQNLFPVVCNAVYLFDLPAALYGVFGGAATRYAAHQLINYTEKIKGRIPYIIKYVFEDAMSQIGCTFLGLTSESLLATVAILAAVSFLMEYQRKQRQN
ncbi:MAG: hypothetical protein HAW62_03970 [Endozoicomonadaceae bacterium]|nr:hypothetical protein [Endozoicomonadaceae bacterium]